MPIAKKKSNHHYTRNKILSFNHNNKINECQLFLELAHTSLNQSLITYRPTSPNFLKMYIFFKSDGYFLGIFSFKIKIIYQKYPFVCS